MKSNERRMSPRKTFATSIRFRQITEEIAASISAAVGMFKSMRETRATMASLAHFAAEAVNTLERGLCLLTAEKLEAGEPLEMNFTLPHDSTGRVTEDVCCNARVLHVDPESPNGARRIVPNVESFKPARTLRSWDNEAGQITLVGAGFLRARDYFAPAFTKNVTFAAVVLS